jgi:cytochrome c6
MFDVKQKQEGPMNSKTRFTTLTLMAAGLLFAACPGGAEPVGDDSGKALFEQHCAVCHPDGGNIINPEKPLDGATLAANGIETAEEIVATLRKPGPGMITFGPEVISDDEAREIADYILKTF